MKRPKILLITFCSLVGISIIVCLLKENRDPQVRIIGAKSYQDYVCFDLLFQNPTSEDFTIVQELRNGSQFQFLMQPAAAIYFKGGKMGIGIVTDQTGIDPDDLTDSTTYINEGIIEKRSADHFQKIVDPLSSIDPYAVPNRIPSPPFPGFEDIIKPLTIPKDQSVNITMIMMKELPNTFHHSSFKLDKKMIGNAEFTRKPDQGIRFGARIGDKLFKFPKIGSSIRRICRKQPFIYKMLTSQRELVRFSLEDWINFEATSMSGRIVLNGERVTGNQ